MPNISISDWVLISTTLFLGTVAPLLASRIKNWWMRPILSIEYLHAPPGTHKTRLDVPLSPSQIEARDTYYFRFAVTNAGRTQAHRCEVVLEELWHPNTKGGLVRLPTFGSIGLIWGSGYGEFVEINPSRKFFCDFLTIPDDRALEMIGMRGGYVSLGHDESPTSGLVLCTKAAFYSQPNRLPPGAYRLKVAVFSENADPVRASFEVAWSGSWQAQPERMLAQCTVRQFEVT
jgi:hypothetical protein